MPSLEEVARLERLVATLSARHAIARSPYGTRNLDAVLRAVLDVAVVALKGSGGTLSIHALEPQRPAACASRGETGSSTGTHTLGAALHGSAGEELGTLRVTRRASDPAFLAEDTELFASLAAEAATTIAHARRYFRATIDVLTSLHVRRYFDGWLLEEMARSRCLGQELSLIFLDLDRFKSVNDRYGFQVGDAVLQNVAWVLREGLKPTAIAARFGGEEFMVGLPGADRDEAERTAADLLNRVRSSSVSDGPRIVQGTISAGVVIQSVSGPECWSDFIRFADRAMYAAKEAGRDRFVVHEPWMEPASSKPSDGEGGSRPGSEGGSGAPSATAGPPDPCTPGRRPPDR